MTHDERIEVMAKALYRHFLLGECGRFPGLEDEVSAHWETFLPEARAAWAAAGVEEMVREAAKLALYKALSNTPWGGRADSTDEWCQSIVRAVMGLTP
jgi:hypothetical protein